MPPPACFTISRHFRIVFSLSIDIRDWYFDIWFLDLAIMSFTYLFHTAATKLPQRTCTSKTIYTPKCLLPVTVAVKAVSILLPLPLRHHTTPPATTTKSAVSLIYHNVNLPTIINKSVKTPFPHTNYIQNHTIYTSHYKTALKLLTYKSILAIWYR
jgi:hypothetical protein